MRKLGWCGVVLWGLLAGCAGKSAHKEPEPEVQQLPNPEMESDEGVEEPVQNTGSEEGKAPLQQVAVMAAPEAKDPVRIEALRILRGVLEVSVSYGGGCTEHSFVMGWDGTFQQGADGTPVANLTLVHDAHEDRCKAIKFATPRFDLAPIRDAFHQKFDRANGKVDLALPAQPTLRYQF
jgi:hypothetical protein